MRNGASVSTSSCPSGTRAAASRSPAAFLKVTGPANDSTYPASTQVRAIAASPEKQWKTTAVGRALLVQDAQDVVVRVPVVDHQRLAQALGEVDVPAERALLGVPGAVVPVVVETGLADGDHPRVGGEPLDLGAVVVGERGRAGRVQGDGGGDAVVPVRGVDHPAGAREVVGDGDDAGHADRGRPVQRGDDVRGVDAAAGVEMGVRVDGRHAQGLGRLRPGAPPVRAGHADGAKAALGALNVPKAAFATWVPPAHRAIGAQSGPVSPSSGSSFGKIGVGLTSGRPTSTGVDAQRACSPA